MNFTCKAETCHVHVDPDYFGKLPSISGDENDLLDSTSCRNEFSRLSCQLRLTPELDGLRVTIAAED
ncbi:MAG TPA: hypothetical protein VEQ16_12200 [Acidocella sp.]|nr:hypothetical protein [Acidocella sp.]